MYAIGELHKALKHYVYFILFKTNGRGDCLEIFGGYNAFGENTTVYKSFVLPPHTKIRIKASLWR